MERIRCPNPKCGQHYFCVTLRVFLHSGVGELLFWGAFAKKYKPFGISQPFSNIRFFIYVENALTLVY